MGVELPASAVWPAVSRSWSTAAVCGRVGRSGSELQQKLNRHRLHRLATGKQNTKTSRVSTRGSTLELLQFSGGNLRRLHAHQHPTTISALAFSQDDRLAIGDATGRVELRDLQLSPLEILAESSDNPVSQLAFCNDDATLAVASGAPTIRSGTKTTGKSKARSSGDNQQVVESSLRLINLKDKSWSTPVAFASLTSFFISPDQRWAAVVSGESVSLLNMSTPTEPLATLPITNAQDLAFHPSGKWLAAAIGDGSIALYPIPVTAKQLLSMVSTKPLVIPSYHPHEQHSSNHQIAFDTEGKLLVSTGGRGCLLSLMCNYWQDVIQRSPIQVIAPSK